MIDVDAIVRMQQAVVTRWHSEPVDNPYDGFLALACRQCSFNFLLWHEEDQARSPTADNSVIAAVKRNIDRYNQQRNDAIEQLDDWITERLASLGIVPVENAPLNTETVGSVIDRLSILTLRIYHLREQLERTDATPEHRESVARKLALGDVQHLDLSQSLRELVAEIHAGRKRHKTYRQMKMYNDPNLNPYLYQARSKQ